LAGIGKGADGGLAVLVDLHIRQFLKQLR
jgi:hypothetical protein